MSHCTPPRRELVQCDAYTMPQRAHTQRFSDKRFSVIGLVVHSQRFSFAGMPCQRQREREKKNKGSSKFSTSVVCVCVCVCEGVFLHAAKPGQGLVRGV